jgi:hypothetical protein
MKGYVVLDRGEAAQSVFSPEKLEERRRTKSNLKILKLLLSNGLRN